VNLYVINLDDKIHRYEKFYDLKCGIERFSAIDSREDYRVCEKFGLKLSPVGLADKLYFSQTTGAVGAFCSHYLLWKRIVDENIPSAMIFEDDAFVDDIYTLLKSKYTVPVHFDFFQFNKRWHHQTNYHKNFDGLESYYITNRGATKLIEFIKQRDHWNGHVRSGPFGRFTKSPLASNSLFLNDVKTQNWSNKNTIVCAIDKFVGFAATPSLKNHISIGFDKKVSVYEQCERSDIELNGIKPWHTMVDHELTEFLKSSYFEYWNKSLFVSPKHIPRKKIKISFLTSSMNRCDDLKKTYMNNIKLCCEKLNFNFEFVLLDYNSTDDIQSWVVSNNFGKYCNFKFKSTKKYKYFNMSLAKNIVGCNASGEILCWLDADNIITEKFLEFISHNFVQSKNIYANVENVKNNEGSCGRVICSKDNFYEVGGYDESFDGWGYEDIDFANRLNIIGVKRIGIPTEYVESLPTDEIKKFENYEKPIVKIKNGNQFSQFRYSSNFENYVKSKNNSLNRFYRANDTNNWGVV